MNKNTKTAIRSSMPKVVGSPTKESVAMLYSPHEHYFSMIINKLQKIPLLHSNKQTTNHYKQTKPIQMKTLPILKLQMMKNCILLFLLLLTVSSSAQIVNIPDANFKAKLIALGFDTNTDGEIQNSEALAVTILNVSNSNIASLIGITSFTNLIRLYCNNNQIINLDVSGSIGLSYLDCDNNQLTSLNLTGCIDLTQLRCGNNQLSTLDVSDCVGLTSFDCAFNNLTNLNVNNLINLQYLSCPYNQLTSLDLSNILNLLDLNCSVNLLTVLTPNSHNTVNCQYNLLTNLNLGDLHLTDLSCTHNQLTELVIPHPESIHTLYFSYNNVSSINLSLFSNLKYLNCDNNPIASMNFSNVNLLGLSCGPLTFSVNIDNQTNLKSLYFYGNSQGSINFLNFPNLTQVHVENSNLNMIDLSNCTQLNSFQITNNVNLEYLNLKNGGFWASGNLTNDSITQCPNLKHLCVDEADINAINSIYTNTTTNNQNVVINTYCSFTPGGNYNTITGTAISDANIDGCDATDALFPNIKMKMQQWGTNSYTFSNSLGIYKFYTTFADQGVEPIFENPTYFNASPAIALVSFADNNNNISTNNFCITANGTHNDLEVVLSPISAARPGFDAHYKLVYKNKGNQTLSGNLALTFDDAHIDFVAANPVASQTANVLNWSYNNLLPFETRVIQLSLHLNSPLDTPALNSGDILDFATSITPVVNDDLPTDNAFVLHQTVVNSYDPNDIQCIEGSTVLPTEIGKYLHYAVQFENTGTAAAENIVVKDVIDTTKYDMDSLQLLDASAPVYARITGNVVEFIFKNIQLSPATGNPPVGGHGDILFKIKSKNTLVTGNMVEKQAKIYFDYNAPINTNIAQTTFAELSNTVFTKDNSITVAPNPTHALITINGNSAIKSITLFDVQGRILETVLNNNTIDLADKTNGIYFLKITSEKGCKVEKVLKE